MDLLQELHGNNPFPEDIDPKDLVPDDPLEYVFMREREAAMCAVIDRAVQRYGQGGSSTSQGGSDGSGEEEKLGEGVDGGGSDGSSSSNGSSNSSSSQSGSSSSSVSDKIVIVVGANHVEGRLEVVGVVVFHCWFMFVWPIFEGDGCHC